MVKYSVNILWSEEDKGFIATVPEFPGLSAFGETYEEALKETQAVLDGYISVLSEDGENLPEPNTVNNYSGQIRIRMPRELHRQLAIESARQNMSLNSYMVSLLSMSFVFNRLEGLEKNMQVSCAAFELTSPIAAGSRFIAQGSSFESLSYMGGAQTVAPLLLSRGGK